MAAAFLDEIFRPSRLETRPLLRGVYFTSGTQNGTPIDRLLGAMSGQFGLPRQSVTAFSGAGRSYFLQRLMPRWCSTRRGWSPPTPSWSAASA